MAEEVYIVIDILQAVVGYSQRAGTSKFNTPLMTAAMWAEPHGRSSIRTMNSPDFR